MSLENKIVFDAEVQLLRWSETSNQGATITLQLANPADLERFKTMTLAKGKQAGQRLAAVMVEIGEDEKPVDQPAPVAEPKAKVGELCIMACNFCADVRFHAWLIECFPGNHPIGEEQAKVWILNTCLIKSRKELDTDKYAAVRFHTLIREPFLAWKGQQ